MRTIYTLLIIKGAVHISRDPFWPPSGPPPSPLRSKMIIWPPPSLPPNDREIYEWEMTAKKYKMQLFSLNFLVVPHTCECFVVE